MAKQFKDTILADWKKEVFDFKGKVNNALDEIHKCKQQIAALKAELVDESTGGQYTLCSKNHHWQCRKEW